MINPIEVVSDRSYKCNWRYLEMVSRYHRNEISEEEFNRWWDDCCGQCIYLLEMCMYGEE